MKNYVPEKLMLVLKWTEMRRNGTSLFIHEGQFNVIIFFPGITASWLLLYTSVIFSNLITVKNNQLVMILFEAETTRSQKPATEQLHTLIRQAPPDSH